MAKKNVLKKNVVEYRDFGNIIIYLDNLMNERGISTYELCKSTGIRYQTIQKLREAVEVTRVNLDVIAKICYVLEIDISELLKYEKPKE